MGYFLIYQLLPLACLGILFQWLGKWEWFIHWGLTLIFLGGALLQLSLWWASTPSLLNPDSNGFYLLSKGMETDLRSILYRPKLYPLFLGCFTSLKVAVFMQCLLKLATGGFIIGMGKLLAWRMPTLACILFLFLTNSLWLQEPLRILDTTLFTFLLTGFFYLTLFTLQQPSWIRFTMLCLFAALTTLVRQVGDVSLVLVIVGVAWISIVQSKQKIKGILVSLLLGMALASSGAIINYWHYGICKRSIALGVSLYTHQTQYALADVNSSEWKFVEGLLPSIREKTEPWKTNYHEQLSWTVNAIPHQVERALGSQTLPEILHADKILCQRFFAWAYTHPQQFIFSFQNELKRLLLKCEEYGSESLLGKIISQPIPFFILRMERGILYQPPWLLLCLGILGIIIGRGNRMGLLLLGIACLSYLVLIALIMVGFTRYVLSIFPCLLVLSGQAITNHKARIRANNLN